MSDEELLSATGTEDLTDMAVHILDHEYPDGIEVVKKLDWVQVLIWVDMAFKTPSELSAKIREKEWGNIYDHFPAELLNAWIAREKTTTPHPDFKSLNKLYVRATTKVPWD